MSWGHKQTLETRRKISETLKGSKQTKEHIEHVKAALVGKKRPETQSENHFAWKGDKASYRAKHYWIVNHFGKADHCFFDSSHESKRFEWANVSGAYLRDVADWAQLCTRCHKEYDIIRRGYTTMTRKGLRLAYQNKEVIAL